jgi:type IV pilus assembly protein PilA
VRSKISEAMAGLAEGKTTIAEYYAANLEFPVAMSSFGINTAIRGGEILKSMDILAAGTPPVEPAKLYAVVYASTWGGAGGATGSVMLSGSTNNDGTMTWVCLPGVGTGHTTIPPKYLPANCRG